MPRLLTASLLVLGAAAAQFYSGAAQAHIHLLEPTPRYPDQVAGENKSCPCGVGRSNRICQFEEDYSDPDRSTDRITTFEAGSTVTVRWDEYVAHAGRYRIAFDQDGADMVDFNADPLADIPDPGGRRGNAGEGSIWELEVTLPETPCENCTLQLIQVMDGETEQPVDNPIGRNTYYQCADIRIVEDLPDEAAGCGLAAAPRGERGPRAALLAVLGLVVCGWRRSRRSLPQA
jgi:chitin binding protein